MVESEIKSPLLHGRCNLIAVAGDLKRSFWLSVFSGLIQQGFTKRHNRIYFIHSRILKPPKQRGGREAITLARLLMASSLYSLILSLSL
jgi:hypothetical protein